MLALFGSLFPILGNAQGLYYLTVGFNQSYASPDSLNFVIDNFNARNTWIEKEMNHISLPNGFTASGGFGFGKLHLDVSFVGKSQVVRARSAQDAGLAYREDRLKFRMNVVDAGLGFDVLNQERSGLSLGLSVTMGGLKVFRKNISGTNTQQARFFPVMNDLALGNTVWLQYLVKFGDGPAPALAIRPYYNFAWIRNDYNPVNRTLNFNTYLQDPIYLPSYGHNFGLRIMVGLAGRTNS